MWSSNSIISLSYELSNKFVLLPFILAVMYFKRLDKPMLFLFGLITVSLVFEVLIVILIKRHSNTYFLTHFYTIIEFMLISFFYISYFKRYIKTFYFYVPMPLLLAVSFYEYKVYGLEKFDTFSVLMESVFLICFAMYFFYFVLKNLLIEDLLNSAVFWMNSAVLLYFSGNLFLFSFSDYLIQTDPTKRYILWGTIHSFFNIMFNLFIAIGFWKTKTK